MWTCLEKKHNITIDKKSGMIYITNVDDISKKTIIINHTQHNEKHITNKLNKGFCPVCYNWGDELWICNHGHCTTFNSWTEQISSFDFLNGHIHTFSLNFLNPENRQFHAMRLKKHFNISKCPSCIHKDFFIKFLLSLETKQ